MNNSKSMKMILLKPFLFFSMFLLSYPEDCSAAKIDATFAPWHKDYDLNVKITLPDNSEREITVTQASGSPAKRTTIIVEEDFRDFKEADSFKYEITSSYIKAGSQKGICEQAGVSIVGAGEISLLFTAVENAPSSHEAGPWFKCRVLRGARATPPPPLIRQPGGKIQG